MPNKMHNGYLTVPVELIDRFEQEQADPKKDEEDCSLSFYGYVRGASLRDNKRVCFFFLQIIDKKF